MGQPSVRGKLAASRSEFAPVAQDEDEDEAMGVDRRVRQGTSAAPPADDDAVTEGAPSAPRAGAAPGDEHALEGGNVNQVARVGDTVRRAAGPWTPTVQRLLAHVRTKGLAWVPEPRGLDEQGREVLSFLPGDVPHDLPPWVWSESVLRDAARALRQWHDATVDFDARGAVWSLTPREPPEVICHNDFAPYNCVFRERRFAGAFDFDTCAPGPRIWDVAYAAYRFVPLLPEAGSPPAAAFGEASPFSRSNMRLRLNRFLDTYSAGGRVAVPLTAQRVLVAAADRLDALANWTDEHARGSGALALKAHTAMYRAHAAWLRATGDAD